MKLKDILAISGQGGLFQYISQARNGIVVEHLETKKRINAYATVKISALEDIAIYTEEEDMPLAEVLKSIREKENGGQAINHKSSAEELKSYFGEILPTYDRERVYMSDIKKVISWYNILQKLDLLSLIDTVGQEDEEKETEDEAKDKE